MGNIIGKVVDYSNIAYDKMDELFDYLSFHMCPNKPSHKLAMDNLHMPAEDRNLVMMVLEILSSAIGLAIVPFKLINDKKFTPHIYESLNVFMMQNAQQPQNIVNICDKVLMYIAQNTDKIAEPENKRITKTVDIHNNNYTIPVNFWYTFNIDNTHKVYIFVYISVISNYRGVAIATDRNNIANMTLFRTQVLDNYNQNNGAVGVAHIIGQQADFI
jgi:hypothetical protein